MGDLHSFRVGDDEFAVCRARRTDLPEAAFEQLDTDPAQLLAVVTAADDDPRAFAWRGAARTDRVGASARRGCALVQLTSDRTRADAHCFYARLGFVDWHVGYKLDLAAG